jgi:hypothetical protein
MLIVAHTATALQPYSLTVLHPHTLQSQKAAFEGNLKIHSMVGSRATSFCVLFPSKNV